MSNKIMNLGDKEYVPGIKIQDFATRGRVSRIKGKTTNRVYHLLSDLETNVFYLLDFEGKITDIKEHYPLLDLHEVVEDLSDIKLEKFKNKKTGEEYTFTTTFVITLKGDGEEKYLALSVRNETELYRDLLLEKLEVERRYWSKKRIRWSIITNKDISMTKVDNIKWLYLGDIDIEYEEEGYIKEVMVNKITSNKCSIKEILDNVDRELSLPIGTALVILKRMIIFKEIIVDLHEPIDIGVSADKFTVNYKEVRKNVQ
ncbi:TnsA endonuclease C-terminal domain-containing protein [Clostridium pasteurianum]|uniref:TnsA endonuclease C-terminal domain-containing protein n=1 Tax=Clostridium pasteurianum TaxID=1501 RepID=UPI0022609676|nr:TnsA endonuclease C-terminal domain-containing protein [Clostridium pasteurianum]UZW12832.1 TnsA endonuclease C-terminal domain-containing protein [Clostridium pasteurianum]